MITYLLNFSLLQMYRELQDTSSASPHLKWDIVLAQYIKEVTLTNSFKIRVLPNTISRATDFPRT